MKNYQLAWAVVLRDNNGREKFYDFGADPALDQFFPLKLHPLSSHLTQNDELARKIYCDDPDTRILVKVDIEVYLKRGADEN